MLACGVAQSLHAAEVGGIGLDQVGIELMLANDPADAIADLRVGVIPVPVGRLRQLLGL